MLVPPASAFSDFVRDIRLFRLIVIVEMPRQIPDGTEPDDEQEESALSGPARDKTREKILDVFQKYLIGPGKQFVVASWYQRPLAVCSPWQKETRESSRPYSLFATSAEFHSDPVRESLAVFFCPFPGKPRHKERETNRNDHIRWMVRAHHDAGPADQ